MRKSIAALLLVVIFATGCAAGFDREGTIEDVMADGLSREQATCSVDSMVEQFGEDRVTSDEDLSSEEQEILVGIMVRCLGS